MKRLYTPGPWTFLQDGDAETLHLCQSLTICSPDKQDLAEVFSEADSTVAIPREQAIANAKLIAAAPVMAETLREVREFWLGGDCPAELMERIEAALADAGVMAKAGA